MLLRGLTFSVGPTIELRILLLHHFWAPAQLTIHSTLAASMGIPPFAFSPVSLRLRALPASVGGAGC